MIRIYIALLVTLSLSALATAQTKPSTRSSEQPSRADLPKGIEGDWNPGGNTTTITLIHKRGDAAVAAVTKHYKVKPFKVKTIDEGWKQLKPVGGEDSGAFEPAVFLVQLKNQPWAIIMYRFMDDQELTILSRDTQSQLLMLGFSDAYGAHSLRHYVNGKEIDSIVVGDKVTVSGNPAGADAVLASDVKAYDDAHAAFYAKPHADDRADWQKLDAKRRDLFSRIFANHDAYLPAFFDIKSQELPSQHIPQTPGGNDDLEAVYVFKLPR